MNLNENKKQGTTFTQVEIEDFERMAQIREILLFMNQRDEAPTLMVDNLFQDLFRLQNKYRDCPEKFLAYINYNGQ